jgi:membrane protein implicated in regulation of membrane protease activity
MGYISWLVVGAIIMLAEFGVGKFYLLAIGLACIYPAIAIYAGASIGMQLAVFCLGAIVHAFVVMIIRKSRPSAPVAETPTDVGQRVEVIEWLDEGAARVMYRGKEWPADKAEGEMPDADHGIIQAVQYGRLIISTE